MIDLDNLRGKWFDFKHSVLDKWDDLKSDPRKLMVVIGIVFFIIGVGLGYSNNAHGQEPPKPMASCNKGKCVVAEKDWKAFKDFHKRTRDVTASIDEQTERMTQDLAQAHQELARCKAHLQRYS